MLAIVSCKKALPLAACNFSSEALPLQAGLQIYKFNVPGFHGRKLGLCFMIQTPTTIFWWSRQPFMARLGQAREASFFCLLTMGEQFCRKFYSFACCRYIYVSVLLATNVGMHTMLLSSDSVTK